MTRELFAPGTTHGKMTSGIGDLVLLNNDGGLNYIADYGLDGREVIIRVGNPSGAYPADFTTIITCTMELVSFERGALIVRLRDRLFELEKTFQTAKYAGTNTPPNGREGTEDDIKDTPKPMTFGHVTNISPITINASKLMYEVSYEPIKEVTAVYDQGLALSAGAAYASTNEVGNVAPNAGAYRVWPGDPLSSVQSDRRALFRLGGSPNGQVTCDVVEGSVAADRTAGQIINRILDFKGIPASAIVASSITALDAANSAVVGVYVSEETTTLNVIDQVANSVGASFFHTRDGRYSMRRLEAPSGTPVWTFREYTVGMAASTTESDILTLERHPPRDIERGVPAYQIRLNYAKNYTVQESDLAGAVSTGRRVVIGNAWRVVAAEDTSVKNKHLLSPELEFESLIVSAEAASTEADRLLTLRKTRRDRNNLETYVEANAIDGIELGDEVRVYSDRLGYSTGWDGIVIGDSFGFGNRTNVLKLIIWG
jgi:hypothetical protein